MKPRSLSAPEMVYAVDAGTLWAWQLEDALAALYAAQILDAYRVAADRLAAVAHSHAGGLAAADHAAWSIPDPDELGLSLRKLQDKLHETQTTGVPQRDDEDAETAIRVEALRRTTSAGLDLMNISFDLANPLIKRALAMRGQNIGIAATTRREIMASLNESWEAGDSIPAAAKRLRAAAPEVAKHRSVVIARTELIGVVNGGAHGLGSLSNAIAAENGEPILLKTWLTAEDERVRDSHVDAGNRYGAGAGIPMDDAFLVGDSALQYPGDPDGEAEDVIQCRCALSYEETGAEARRAVGRDEDAAAIDDPLTASMEPLMETYQGRKLTPTGALTAAGVAVYEVELPSIVSDDAVPVGGDDGDDRKWTAVLCLEGIATADGRMLGIDSTGWRELPQTLMAMVQTDLGHDGAIIAGRIDTIDRMPAADAVAAGLLEEKDYPPDCVALVGRGVFDTSWQADEVMRLVGERILRGVSIDLAPQRVELLELPPEEGEEYGRYLEIVTAGVIMGATVCPFPAFGEATIILDALGREEPTQAAEEPPVGVVAAMQAKLLLRVRVKAAIVASSPRVYAAVDHSASSMIAVHPTSAEAAALAIPGGQPAGDLHVTLAFLPDADSTDFDLLHKVVGDVAAAHAPIAGKVGGAGYFHPSPDGKKAEPKDDADADEATTAAADPPAVADPETDADSEKPNEEGDGDAPLHPHVALVDAPGLSKMRGALCDALDAAGISYATNHDFTPHITLGYETHPGVPAMEHGGKPLSFGNLSVHQGAARRDHPLGDGSSEDAITASAAGLAPERPPSAWFADPEFDEPTPLTITPEGAIYGHLATWGTCHVGIRDACVEPPESETGYALFHLGHVLSEEDELVPVGTFTMDTGHPDLNLSLRAAQAHYDNTGTAVADVRIGEDEIGIWFAGAIRPDLSAAKVRALRAAQISGDWRPHEGGREFCAGLAVNVPGFPVVRPRTAVAASGQLLGLVAAGSDLSDPRDARTRVLGLAERARPGYLAEARDALVARARG